MKNVNEILNNTIERLRARLPKTEFYFYYPNTTLSLPVKDKQYGIIKASESCSTAENTGNSRVRVEVQLMSPMNYTGRKVLECAEEVLQVLLEAEHGQSTTNGSIGDIEYKASLRCYVIKIAVEYVSELSKAVAVKANNSSINGLLISEKASCTYTDVMVYGESKPYDSVLCKRRYTLKLQIDSLGETLTGSKITVEYQYNKYIVRYTGCCVVDCISNILSKVQTYTLNAVSREVVKVE